MKKTLIPREEIIKEIKHVAIPFDEIQKAPLDQLLDRIGDANVVLLGEATHGTSEFYRMRAAITQELIQKKGFSFVGLEADWTDAMLVNRYVCHLPGGSTEQKAFMKFPQWMWRNQEFHEFVTWLRSYNEGRAKADRTCIYGLDFYCLYQSIQVVIHYLEKSHPHLAKIAREKYNCLKPWENRPSDYGFAAFTENMDCREEVVHVLHQMMQEQVKNGLISDNDQLLDALQNARLIVNAEHYYRSIFDSESSWNIRDTHMFETLKFLLNFKGAVGKAVIWEHNSHVGDARATEMTSRGELNVGQLCKEKWGKRAYSIGFGTHTGAVAAANDWGGKVQIKEIVKSHPDSYERLCHDTGIKSFFLPMHNKHLQEVLQAPKLERAIGVIYSPESELESHYFLAVLPKQFDEYIWFDQTHPVTPLALTPPKGMPDTYPFGL